MQHVRVDALREKLKDITSEGHIENILVGSWSDFFAFSHYATRKKISKRSIVDLIGVDNDNFYLIELKFRPLRHKDRLQLNRYVRDFLPHKQNKTIKSILIGYNQWLEEVEIKL